MGRIRAIIQNDSVSPAAAIALVLACGTVLAACGTATVPSARSPRSAAGAPRGGDAAATVTASPQQRAKADAASVLASIVAPPGAKRLPHGPAGFGGRLSQPETTFDPNHVDDLSFWQVPGTPSEALASVASHLPARFQSLGGGTGGGPGYQVMDEDFTVQSGLAPGDSAELFVDSGSSASGQAYVRVDVQVTWLPTRPAASFLSAGKVHAVVVTLVPDPNDTRKPPPPVTITDSVKVGQLVSLMNGLPMDPPGPQNCPAGGWGLQMEFLATAGGPRLATAYADSGNCGGALLLIGAGKLASRGFAIGGEIGLGLANYRLAPRVAAISGIHWGP
jgi:hypothetical protein